MVCACVSVCVCVNVCVGNRLYVLVSVMLGLLQ